MPTPFLHVLYIDSTDYIPLPDETTIIFPILSTVGARKCLKIVILQDDDTEPSEEFVIKLTNPKPILDDIVIQEPITINITISDCELLSIVWFCVIA